MENFTNWTEVTKNIYRYVIAAKVCYEIFVIYHEHTTDILTAKANLYISGDWHSNVNYFERELLLENKSVSECIKAAINDISGNG